jgi:hypothetical protein
MGRQPSDNTIAALKKQINDLKKAIAAQQIVEPKTIVQDHYREVLVVSLFSGELNLSTEGYGRGEIYTFRGFGEEQFIPLIDLKKIIRKERDKVEAGQFYINDPEIIKSERLQNVYRKILNKDKIEELFTKSHTLFKESFDSMTDGQQEIFSQLIVDKLVNDKDVDMNIVSIVSKAVKKDLNEIVNISKYYKINKEE